MVVDEALAPREIARQWGLPSAVLLGAPQAEVAKNAGTLSCPEVPGYEIFGELGRGGMGIVYRARSREVAREVAIKVIRMENLADTDLLRRFRREIRATARLNHPNIVRVLDAGATAQIYYLIMEYIVGVDLHQLVDDSGPLAVDVACDYIRQASLGLQHAHECGMVHRDIKPGNLIVTNAGPDSGEVKLLDLGLARIMQSNEDESSGSMLTQEGTIVGTPDFIAPEQVENSHAVDIRADLYSLGCTFYYLLTGQTPFHAARTIVEKLDQHRWRPPRAVERLRRGIPPAVSAIVQRLLAKGPHERYQTPQEVADALEAVPASGSLTKTAADFNCDRVTDRRRVVDAELEKLQRSLVRHIERDDLAQALAAAEAMVRLKPDDSLAKTAHAFIGQQLNRVLPPGECACFEVPGDGVACVAVSPDGGHIAAASNQVHVWDVPSKEHVRALASHQDRVRAVAFAPDSSRLLSASRDHSVRLWDVTTGKMLAKYHRHTEAVNSIAFTPSGQGFLSAGADKAVFLWDIHTGHRLAKLRRHVGDVKSVVCSPDGRRALSASWDHTLRLWDLEKGTELSRLGDGHSYYASAAISPDGCLALAAGSDSALRLYSLATGEELLTFEGHTSGIMATAFSPDGRRALSGGADGTVRLWDIATGKALHCFRGHASDTQSVAFFADARRAVSGGGDRTVRIWRLPAT